MITIKVHQYFYCVTAKFSRLLCLTIDSFSPVDIALRRGSIKTSLLIKGLILFLELVIQLVHIVPINKTATLYQQHFAPLEGVEVLAHRNVGNCFGL